jgi:hypothetical protein
MELQVLQFAPTPKRGVVDTMDIQRSDNAARGVRVNASQRRPCSQSPATTSHHQATLSRAPQLLQPTRCKPSEQLHRRQGLPFLKRGGNIIRIIGSGAALGLDEAATKARRKLKGFPLCFQRQPPPNLGSMIHDPSDFCRKK